MTTPTLLPPPARLNSLVATAQMLLADDKGLLAIDESVPTCNKGFIRLAITQDEPARRTYRELILTTPGLGDCTSGVVAANRDAGRNPDARADTTAAGSPPTTSGPGQRVTACALLAEGTI